MISLSIILLILSAHFVADFILQSSWMAVNKSTSNKALSAHMYVYTMTLLVLTIWFGPLWILWSAVNGVLHGLVDYFTSRWSAIFWQKGDTHNFFVVIGLDQLIHAITLLTTYYWIVL